MSIHNNAARDSLQDETPFCGLHKRCAQVEPKETLAPVLKGGTKIMVDWKPPCNRQQEIPGATGWV
jgi:hypothetical protein